MRPHALVLLIAFALIAGCVHAPLYKAKALGRTELQKAREQMRGHAKTHCGSCHMSSLPTARPAALAIYNLDANDWSSTLTAEQLRNGFPRRLNGRLDEDGKR